jgi:type IV pilus assembly protein PilF
MPEAWYSMGYLLESTGNREQARKHYMKALDLAPGRGDVLNNYGTFLCRSGDYKNAIQHFLKAVHDPQYLQPASAYENAGLCALKIPDPEKAMLYFNKAIAEDYNRSTALLELAELNYNQGKYSLARRELDQYLQLSPPNAQSFILEQKIDRKIMHQHS